MLWLTIAKGKLNQLGEAPMLQELCIDKLGRVTRLSRPHRLRQATCLAKKQ